MSPTFSLYNRYSKSIVPLKIDPSKSIKIYSCGPTVYTSAHIGNLRSYIVSDLLRRSLCLAGFSVNMAMNITDVDDKIIDNLYASRSSISSKEITINELREYTKPFSDNFFKDLGKLKIESLEHYPFATDYIKSMIQLIQKLLEKGYAYKDNGSIYFSIKKFDQYGDLSSVDLTGVKAGTRYDTDEYQKIDIRDFVLWKKRKPTQDIFWPSPFGDGRPGWHIECSSMIQEVFNGSIDIHMGGIDLIFPHHENEIAQSCCGYGHEFVRHWLHSEHLLVDNKKMSKSLQNCYTLDDIEQRNIHPLILRFELLSTHYQKKINFTWDSLQQTKEALEKIWMTYLKFIDIEIVKTSLTLDEKKYKEKVNAQKIGFLTALQQDLNISKTLSFYHDFISTVNMIIQDKISKDLSDFIKDSFVYFDKILGILEGADSVLAEQIPLDVQNKFIERESARKEKRYVLADSLREQILKMGYIIQDTHGETKLYKQ